MIGANLAAASVALVAACFLLSVRASAAARPIAILCIAAAFWSVGAAWTYAEPGSNSGANACILAAAASAAAAAFVASQRLVSGRWSIPTLVTIMFFVEPMVIVFVRLVVYPELSSAEFRRTAPFIAHAAYCFALLLSVILTLNVRQRHPRRRVRIFVLTSQVLVIAIIAMEVSASEQTQFVVVLAALFAVWVARHPDDWSNSRARADSLLNSIGVFLFVFDHLGRLKDWNGNADRLIELTGQRPQRDLTATQILGRPLPFEDGQPIDLNLLDGRMRTSAHIHKVDPTSRTSRSDWVVMLRPVRSSVSQSSFPTISGGLAGHDPATQTLNQRETMDLLRAATTSGDAAVRVDVLPADAQAREDETMFVVARRLEMMFPNVRWGRLSAWVFVAMFKPDEADQAKLLIDHEAQTALGLDASVATTICVPTRGEDSERFVLRVQLLHSPYGSSDY
ncbi:MULTISPECIES: hypothetical protein [Aeromicrobium]|uniref:hypothetical protein n=1 Tax=Aeromicrobium TaxID=2040 RepID=UPI00257B23E6|nr:MULTISPECIES: hypothetical protein [Aeromicrobium]